MRFCTDKMKSFLKLNRNFKQLASSKILVKDSRHLPVIKQANFAVENINVNLSHYIALKWLGKIRKLILITRIIPPYIGPNLKKQTQGKRVRLCLQARSQLKISRLFYRYRKFFVQRTRFLPKYKNFKLTPKYVKFSTNFYSMKAKDRFLPVNKNLNHINMSMSLPINKGTLFFRLFYAQLMNIVSI